MVGNDAFKNQNTSFSFSGMVFVLDDFLGSTKGLIDAVIRWRQQIRDFSRVSRDPQ